MLVKVVLSAHLRTLAGRECLDVSVPEGAAVADVVLNAASEGGTALSEFLLDGGKPRVSLMLFLNDEQVFLPDLISTGAKLTIVAPISGG